MYNLSGKYYWDSDPVEKEIILTKIHSDSFADVVVNSLPEEMHIKPEDLITFNVSDMPYSKKGVATTVGTAAIGSMLFGSIGFLMGLGAGARTANKENQKDKKVYFQFRRDNDNNQYEYEGTIPSEMLHYLDGIIDSPDFGKNVSLGESTREDIKEIPSISISLNQNDPAPTIERIKLFLEDGDWDSATQYCNVALDLFPTNSYFYILKYCAKNEIKKMDHLDTEAHGKLYGDDDFQKALRFSSDKTDDAKAIYENSLERAFNDVTNKESSANSSEDYTNMKREMEAIPNYKPAQEKAEEYRLCAAYKLISEKETEYLRTKGFTNSNDHNSMIRAIQKYEQQIAAVKSNRYVIKKYENAEKGNPDDLILEEAIETTMQDTRKQLYELACNYMDEDTRESLEKAQESFRFLGEYGDSREHLNDINQRLKALEFEKQYIEAVEAEEDKDYDRAIAIYRSLFNYKDSQQRIKEAETAKWEAERKEEYNKAVSDFKSGNKHKAKTAFVSLGDYKDSKDYLIQIENAEKKKTRKIVAIIAVIAIAVAGVGFGVHIHKVKKAEEADRIAEQKRQEYAWKEKKALEEALSNNSTGLSTAFDHTVGITNSGTVVSTEMTDEGRDYGQTNVEDWKNIVAISAGTYNTVGLKKDGTVVSTAITDEEVNDGQAGVKDWKDIVAISAGDYNTVGLKKDGTVIITEITDEKDNYGQTEVENWKDIVAISAGAHNTIGLKKDGTVISTKITDEGRDFGQTNVEDWKDIVAISAGDYDYTVGLKKDGTVVSTEITDDEMNDGQTNVEGWKDIVAISAGSFNTIGLKKDGTVVSTEITDEGLDYGQTEVEGWKDIVAISAGHHHTVGLKKDGTVVSTEITYKGYDFGQTNVSSWKEIINNGYKYLSR